MAFDLSSLQKNKPRQPRVIVYGAPGIGKTSLALDAPSPVVIQTEDGLGNADVTAFPKADAYHQVIEALGALYSEEHQFKTLVLDSLDWLEPLIWDKVCADNDVKDISSIPYGRGYSEALNYWREVLSGITALRDHRDMIIVMTAHNQVQRIEDPEFDAYDAHTLKLHKKATAVCEEYADVIAYACQKTAVKHEEKGFNQTRGRAIPTGGRILRLEGTPAYLAKNRYRMPAEVSMPEENPWGPFSEALYGQPTQAQAANQ